MFRRKIKERSLTKAFQAQRWMMQLSNVMPSMKSIILLGFISLIITSIIQQDIILNRIYQPEDKVAVAIQSTRTQLSDKQFYFINAKTVFRNIVLFLKTNDKIYLKSIPSCVGSYTASSFLSGMVTSLAHKVSSDGRNALFISVFCQTFLLVAACISALFLGLSLVFNRFVSVLLLLCLGLGTIAGIDSFSRYFHLISSRDLWGTIPEFVTANPDILRSVNPQISWFYSLCFLCIFHFLFRNPQSTKWKLVFAVWSALVATSGLALSGLFTGAVGLYCIRSLYLYKKSRVTSSYVVTFFTAASILFIGFVISYVLHGAFLRSEVGQYFPLGTKLESFAVAWPFLFFLILLPVINYLEKNEIRYLYMGIVLVEVFLAAFVSLNLNEGSRLWLRSGSMLVWLILVVLIAKSSSALCHHLSTKFSLLSRHRAALNLSAQLALSTIFIFLVWHHHYKLKTNEGSWNGYISSTKWEVLDWLGRHESDGDIVLSPNLEDSYLIPLLTESKSLLNPLATTNDSYDDVFKKYFFALYKFGQTDRFFDELERYSKQQRINDYVFTSKCFRYSSRDRRGCENPEYIEPYWSYQVSEFLSGTVYYSYSTKYKDVFNDHVDPTFISYLRSISERSELLNYSFNWVIYSKLIEGSVPLAINLPTVFENDEYVILKNPAD